jgi:hypothetical protein
VSVIHFSSALKGGVTDSPKIHITKLISNSAIYGGDLKIIDPGFSPEAHFQIAHPRMMLYFL